MIRSLPALLLALVLLTGCRKAEPARPVPGADSTAPPPTAVYRLQAEPDSVKLLLHRQIQLGTRFDALRGRFAGLGKLESEPVAGLSHAFLPVSVMGQKMNLRFSFEHSLLYGYHYEAEAIPCARAEALYRRLQAFYAAQFGAQREEPLEDGRYTAVVSYWTTPQQEDVVLTRGREGNACRLAFGFQKQ